MTKTERTEELRRLVGMYLERTDRLEKAAKEGNLRLMNFYNRALGRIINRMNEVRNAE